MEPTVLKVSKKKIMLWVIIMIMASGLIAFLTLTLLLLNRETIYPKVYIETIEVSGLTKLQAEERIRGIYEKELESLKVDVVYEEYSKGLAYKDLGYTYLYDDAIYQAYRFGRDGNAFSRIRNIYYLRNNPITIPLATHYDKEALEAFIKTIAEDINKEAQEASIKRQSGVFHITKEELGLQVQEDRLKELIAGRMQTFSLQDINIPIETITPEITAEKLLNIKEVIGEFSTAFNLQQRGRNANIALAAKSINGILMMPQEEFSFNDATIPRGVEQGYQEAPVIVNGELVPGIGGGICQVSTTLYNAVVRGNLEITERRNHSLTVPYVPLGHDATIYGTLIDLKFVNNYENPIYIESFVSGDRVFVKIYGSKEDNIVITLVSQVLEVFEPKVEIKKDNNMFIGEQEIKQESKKGYRVNTYKIYHEKGREIKRERISTDYYKPVNAIILEGSKPKPVSKIEEPVEGAIEEESLSPETESNEIQENQPIFQPQE
ncbi:G5 domain-containing protein [Natronincola peptidivorans]|uniref:G5 domain-containing protein n=1 Tax=Natronincola peptidivorans TaxID=426128 RepID=A0A1I0DM52_9FIRM|nr:VanW family protein [Natronincola peptidivorans]SET32766.1 G5 domain-containing protein [Natronincola peptidivorans]